MESILVLNVMTTGLYLNGEKKKTRNISAIRYGVGWILDPEGNKIELWEPVDDVFQKENGL